MITKKRSKKDFKKAIFGIFFAIMGIFSGLATPIIGSNNVYADENEDQTSEVVDDSSDSTEEKVDEVDKNDEKQDEKETDNNEEEQDEKKVDTGDKCQSSLGPVGWRVCPSTEKTASAVDWLFEKLQGILEINPVSAEDGSPIYEIWKYCLSLTNVVFVLFLLVVVYSQITGFGITNYGIKKVLPKIIVTAILVNLSFLICSLAVDVSNILGNGIRELFSAVQDTVMANNGITDVSQLSFAGTFGALAGGTTLAIGATVIAFELGAIWMLIPVILGAIVAVVTGLITVALRQAVVVLLIMIAPLAIVAYILPNTEQWFKKWKQLFTKMLVFYPMFSLLFGASSLAGFAIIASATDGFGVLLGMAVQIFPLFFSWKLMKMSGTFLETINMKMRGLADGPLAKNRAWAESHRQLSKQKHLASGRTYTPSLKLAQFISNRRVAREAEISEHEETVKNRGLAYKANRNYNKNGVPTRRAERAYAEQADNVKYQRDITRDKNNFNKGLAYLATGTKKEDQLKKLDKRNVDESDLLKAEQARTEMIEYENAVGFHKRMEEAVNAHIDMKEGFEYKIGEDGQPVLSKRDDYHFHSDPNKLATSEGMARYNAVSKVMEGNVANVQYVAATAAHGYDTQKKIIETKMQKYFELAPPSKDVNYRLLESIIGVASPENIPMIAKKNTKNGFFEVFFRSLFCYHD